jgi:hypothetical protein
MSKNDKYEVTLPKIKTNFDFQTQATDAQNKETLFENPSQYQLRTDTSFDS